MIHLVYLKRLFTNLPSQLLLLALPSNNLCCPVRVDDWTVVNTNDFKQVAFLVAALSYNIQRGVSTVIRNRAKDY